MRYTISRMPNVLTIRSAMNHFFWPPRAAYQSAYPFKTMVQSATTKIMGMKMLINPDVNGE